VPVAPCPVAGHHWKESGPVLLTPTLQIFRGISKVPSQPSLLQAEQAQLPQPLLVGEMLQSPHHPRSPRGSPWFLQPLVACAASIPTFGVWVKGRSNRNEFLLFCPKRKSFWGFLGQAQSCGQAAGKVSGGSRAACTCSAARGCQCCRHSLGRRRGWLGRAGPVEAGAAPGPSAGVRSLLPAQLVEKQGACEGLQQEGRTCPGAYKHPSDGFVGSRRLWGDENRRAFRQGPVPGVGWGSLLLWRYSRPSWTRSCAACCR